MVNDQESQADLYDLADREFFNQAKVARIIKELGGVGSEDDREDARELVVFCGAGVTIDRTGRGWTELVKSMYSQYRHSRSEPLDEDKLDFLAEVLEPQTMAGLLVAEMRRAADEDILVRDMLRNHLRDQLYALSYWNDGRMIGALSKLVAQRAKMGLRTTVVTTNFDDFLEAAVRKELAVVETLKEKNELSQEADGRFEAFYINYPKLNSADSTEEAPTWTKINYPEEKNEETVKASESQPDPELNPEPEPETKPLSCFRYLHGCIRSTGRTLGDLVLTEEDYLAFGQHNRRLLREVFRDRNLLIVGSSLTDRPLLEALHDTRDSFQNLGARRWAAYPITSAFRDVAGLTKDRAELIAGRLPVRFGGLGLEIVIPDFYSQVPQLLREITLNQSTSHQSYATRLSSWWCNYAKVHAHRQQPPSDFFTKRSEEAQKGLDKLRKEIMDLLTVATGDRELSSEVLKVELWVRIPCDAGKRHLRLIASSAMQDVAGVNPRVAHLSLHTRFSVVKSFQNGRPQFTYEQDSRAADRVRTPDDPRWLTFLSVPIHLSGDRNIPVGVVVVASSALKGKTGLDLISRRALREIVGRMAKVGSKYLSGDEVDNDQVEDG